MEAWILSLLGALWVGPQIVVAGLRSGSPVYSVAGLAIVAGRAYKLRLRAPDRAAAGFSVTLTVA